MMEVDLLNFVLYFIIYLVLGFIFFHFVLFKKRGSNIVSTICLLLVILSQAIGFNSAMHLAIINLFILVLAFWFAYIMIKMYRQDKIDKYQQQHYREKDYMKRMQKKFMERDLSDEDEENL